jgi:arabinofuranosyltransferase
MQDRIVRHSSSLTFALLVLLSLFPLIAAYRYPRFLNDDSYITLTYAKNLANGNGFVFNHPPAVLGTTTPLFTIVVAGLALVLPRTEIPTIAVFLSGFCWLGVVWTLFAFRKHWGLENWHVCIVAFVLIGLGWIGYLGMEAYPFAFLLVLSLSLFLSERYWLTGIVVGLLFLTRGEGVLVLGILMIAIPIQQWGTSTSFDRELVRRALKLLIGFGLPALLWGVYAHLTFGSLLPNTLAAKQAQGQYSFSRPFLQRLVDEWMPLWGKRFGVLHVVGFWWLFVLVGFIDVLLRKRRWLMLVGWITLYILGYSLLNVSAYSWYQLPILFVLDVLFGLGIVKVVELLLTHIEPRSLSLGTSALFVLLLVLVTAKPAFNAMLAYQGDARGDSYTALSRWFREHTTSSESIAFIEIGYLGYYTENRIIDLAGLVLPDVVPHVAEGDFAWGFWRYEPDYYVYLRDFDWALASIRTDPRFTRQYRPVATLRGPREVDFVIYARISR